MAGFRFAIQSEAIPTCNYLQHTIKELSIMFKLCHLGLFWFGLVYFSSIQSHMYH